MVNVDIDADLYEDIKSIVKQNRLDYPSIRHFVQKMLLEKVVERKRLGVHYQTDFGQAFGEFDGYGGCKVRITSFLRCWRRNEKV